MSKTMRILAFLTLLTASGLYLWQRNPAGEPVGVTLSEPPPPATLLTATPRATFTPTTRKGYWNIDVVGDFTLPKTKSLTFSGAGRNLHVQQDWSKLFRRGFSSIDRSRMVADELQDEHDRRPPGWKSRLRFDQRAFTVGQGYFAEQPFLLQWARNSDHAPNTWYRRPDNDPNGRQSLFRAAAELCGGCVAFNDCPPDGMKSTYGKIYLDIENEGASFLNRQEQVNLYVYLMQILRQNTDPRTQIGSIAPVPHNGFGYSKAAAYEASADWLWSMPAQHTRTSRERGMSDDIVGKSYADLAHFQMPGTYYFYPDFDYTASHTKDDDRHWLGSLLHEQEVNARLSDKPRVAWQWLFNTQSSVFPNSGKASNPAPPIIAEGIGIFYWFTGAYGAVFWDDHNDLTPDLPTPPDEPSQGVGNDRNYACYEHYIHGLWRLFKHHGDLFNGRETYLNESTDCSYDGGRTWYTYNANQLKTRNLPFVRAIVNGDQILVAATRPYAPAGQVSTVQLRYVQNGYSFYTTLTLKGDEIYLGRATMPRGANARKASSVPAKPARTRTSGS